MSAVTWERARPRSRLLVVLSVVLLAACSGSDRFADIKQFMDQVDAKPKGRIEPLPEFEAYQAFAYSASDMRSPFDPPVEVKPVDPSKRAAQVKPDFDRVKQYLEQFNMSQLAMVGTLAQGASMFGLIRDVKGGVHRVQIGDYMGTDNGKIVSISEGRIEMREIVSDGTGGWIERERTVSLGGAQS
jgi:type IV pilus assembly protein PilP